MVLINSYSFEFYVSHLYDAPYSLLSYCGQKTTQIGWRTLVTSV